MSRFAEFNLMTGQIIRRGIQIGGRISKVRKKNALAFIETKSIFDIIKCDSVNPNGVAKNPTIRAATQAEINERRSFSGPRRVIPTPRQGQQRANITNDQLDEMNATINDLQNRLVQLEN